MASYAPMERGVLRPDRPVPMASAPVVDGRLGPSKACPPCLAPPPPRTVSGSRPLARDAQKVHRGRTFPTRLRRWRTPDGPQARVVRGQGQSAARHPFVTYRHHPTRRVLPRTAADESITGAHQGRFPLTPGLHCGVPPHVAPVMHIAVPSQRGEHCTLGGTPLRLHQRVAVASPPRHALAHASPQRPIGHPHPAPLLQCVASQAVDTGHAVRLVTPSRPAPVAHPLQGAHGLRGLASGAEAYEPSRTSGASSASHPARTASWTNVSAHAERPMGRVFPCALGMDTRRSGGWRDRVAVSRAWRS